MLLFLTNMVRFGYVKIIMEKRLSLTDHIVEWCCLDRFVVHFYQGLLEWRFLLPGVHHGLGSEPQFGKFRAMILSVYKAHVRGTCDKQSLGFEVNLWHHQLLHLQPWESCLPLQKKGKNNNSTYFIGLLWWLRLNIKKQNYFR